MRSNTPVTPTHHETPPPPLLPLPPYTLHAHQHPKRPSLTRRVVGLVWWRSRDTRRTGRWRESQCGMRSSSYRHARSTYQPNHFISAKSPVLAAEYIRQVSMTCSYLFRLRTNDISRQDQDSQFCLLTATSVARGEKSSLRHFVSGNMRSSF